VSEPQNFLLHRVACTSGTTATGKLGTSDAQLGLKHGTASDLTEAIELALQFAQFVRQRQPDKLDPWLEQAQRASFLLSTVLPLARRL